MRNPVQRLFFCSSTHRLYAGIAGRLQSFDTRTGCQLEQFEWEAPPSQPPPAGISKKKKNKSIGIGKVDMDADVGGRSIASLGSESGSGASMVVGEGGSIAEMVAVEEEGKGGRGGRGLTGSPAAKKRRVEEEEGGGSSTGTTTTTVTTTSATAAAAATTTTTNSTTTTTAPAENTPAPTPGPDTPQQQKGKRGRKSKIGPRAGAGWAEAHRGINSITSIAATRSGRYLVLASNEDKSVRVFDTGKGENGEGRIVMLSER